MASVATYSGYAFQSNEVNLVRLSKTVRYSPRNKRLSTTWLVHGEGELIYDGPTAITAKIREVENAFRNDGGDFRYTVGGALSHSLLNSSDCVSGVKVIQPPSFPKGDPSQLATTRTFSFTLQATYDTPDTDLVSWTETIETVGNGGPKFFVVETITVPQAFYTSSNSAVYYTQSGSAVGYMGYPNPNGPLSTSGEFGWRRRITQTSGRNMGQGLRFFTTRWSYHFGNDPATFGSFSFTPTSQ